jgi:aminoglycoside N3'-acetyltransferase
MILNKFNILYKKYLKKIMWNYDKLRKFLSKVYIKEDFIIIHSDVTGLVFPKFDLNELWKIIFSSFGKNKTYIFPTFTLNNHKKYWSYNQTKSDVGILSEYFRKNISSIRTIHPIHSVSIFGKNSFKIPIKHCSSSFGKNSFWEWACNNNNVCNISLGLELNGGATFCHYVEEYCKVPYRKYINLNYIVKDKQNKNVKKKYTYFSRNVDAKQEIINDWDRVQKILIKQKLINIYKNANPKYQVLTMNTSKVSNFLIRKVKKNKNFLLKDYL